VRLNETGDGSGPYSGAIFTLRADDGSSLSGWVERQRNP
jgi:hypothetical protein